VQATPCTNGNLPGVDGGGRWCPVCFRSLWGRRAVCRRRDCESYAGVYLRDQAQKLKANLASWDYDLTIATVTAPGADVLPWDPTRCSLPPGHQHSGPNGCSVNPWQAGAYNAAVCQNLSRLTNAAQQQVRRGHRGARVYVLGYSLEEKRGVWHVHLVLGYKTAKDRAALDTFTGYCAEHVTEYGFGSIFDAGKPGHYNGRSATYIAKYLRPDSAKGTFVPLLRHCEQMAERNPETGRKPQLRPVYVSPMLTRQTGVTMRYLRFKRWVWKAWGPGIDHASTMLAYELHRTFGAVLIEHQVPEVERKPEEAPIPF
jgi:hypothetical protein